MNCLVIHTHPEPEREPRNKRKQSQTDPVIRPEVIYLLIPTCRPEVFTDEFDAIKRLSKVWFSVA